MDKYQILITKQVIKWSIKDDMSKKTIRRLIDIVVKEKGRDKSASDYAHPLTTLLEYNN